MKICEQIITFFKEVYLPKLSNKIGLGSGKKGCFLKKKMLKIIFFHFDLHFLQNFLNFLLFKDMTEKTNKTFLDFSFFKVKKLDSKTKKLKFQKVFDEFESNRILLYPDTKQNS